MFIVQAPGHVALYLVITVSIVSIVSLAPAIQLTVEVWVRIMVSYEMTIGNFIVLIICFDWIQPNYEKW